MVEATSTVCRVEKPDGRFRRGYGDAHGFRVAHFAHYDDVRSLAQGGRAARGKIGSVGADFDLFDDTAHVAMLVLDGIFDDDNVAGFAMIDFVMSAAMVVDLPGARPARRASTSRAWETCEIFYGWREMEFLERRNFVGQSAMAAAARNVRWRLMRKRPSPSIR